MYGSGNNPYQVLKYGTGACSEVRQAPPGRRLQTGDCKGRGRKKGEWGRMQQGSLEQQSLPPTGEQVRQDIM